MYRVFGRICRNCSLGLSLLLLLHLGLRGQLSFLFFLDPGRREVCYAETVALGFDRFDLCQSPRRTEFWEPSLRESYGVFLCWAVSLLEAHPFIFEIILEIISRNTTRSAAFDLIFPDYLLSLVTEAHSGMPRRMSAHVSAIDQHRTCRTWIRRS